MLSTVRTTLTSNTYHTVSISENISYNILCIITKTFHDWFVFEWELMTAVAKGLGNVKMRGTTSHRRDKKSERSSISSSEN